MSICVQEGSPSLRDKFAHKVASASVPNLNLNLDLNLIRKPVSNLNFNLSLNLV
jgi:hypothetical protein